MRRFNGLDISSISTLAFPDDYVAAATENIVMALHPYGLVIELITEVIFYFLCCNYEPDTTPAPR